MVVTPLSYAYFKNVNILFHYLNLIQRLFHPIRPTISLTLTSLTT